MSLKRVEAESLLKSFMLFFLSQTLLIALLFFLNFQKEKQQLDTEIFSQMRICSFDLQCREYKIDFVPKDKHELYKLYKTAKEISSYFTIPSSQGYYLKIYLEQQQYAEKIATIRDSLLVKFLFLELIVALLSFGFALYALSPLRNALRLTEEFIKDILHDFNTPLSTLRLNIAMLKKKCPQIKQIPRIENSVATILQLQTNLRAYLHSHTTQKELFRVDVLVDEHVSMLRANYKDIDFQIHIPERSLFTNRDAFIRILDNLLSNAAKYNKKHGSVKIALQENTLIISDTGKGIQNPKRVFERFYKEQERGIGIGLHIVKKLCDELDITVSLQSEVSQGTTFKLDLSKLLAG
jgi:signal transduction histidine kinase